MELRQLRYFVKAAREGTFTRAAEQLFMAQPPLSLQIHKLEEELGVQLFERAGRGVVLTAPGRAFLVKVERLLRELDTVVQEARDLAGAGRGTLAIGAVPVLATTILPGAVAEVHRRLPGIDFHLYEGGPADVAERVREYELEMGFVPLPAGLPELEEIGLWENEMVLVTPPGHRLAHRKQVRLADLASERFVFPSRARTPVIYETIVEACRVAGFEPQIVCKGPGPDTIVRLVEAAIGISVLPRISAQIVPGSSVALIPISEPPLRARYGVLRRQTGYVSKAAKTLLAAVSDPDFLNRQGIEVRSLGLIGVFSGSHSRPAPSPRPA